MKLILTGRHMEIGEADRQQIEKKLARIDRLLRDSAVSAQCVVWQERGRTVCELTVHARQDNMLHAVGRHGQLMRAFTLAADKVLQQAQRLKDRWKTRRRARVVVADGEAGLQSAAGSPAAGDATPRIIRSRRSAVKPMSLDDAMLALSSGNRQDFLVFRDASSETVSILYRRPDGHFGLIEPEA
jgi:putative sigma-54 modulation protein